MQFLPIVIVVLGVGLLALLAIVAMMIMQKPDIKGISPHHRANTRTDLLNAREAETSRNRTGA